MIRILKKAEEMSNECRDVEMKKVRVLVRRQISMKMVKKDNLFSAERMGATCRKALFLR